MEPAARPRLRRPPRRRRRPGKITQAELLDAGIQLIEERGLGEPLGHLRITDVARAAGLTTGAFYHYWPTQDDYRADVLAAALATDRVDADLALPAAGAGPSAVRATVGALADRLRVDAGFRLDLALWAQADDVITDGLHRRSASARQAWVQVVGGLLEATGRRPDDGWTVADLAAVGVALADGLRMQCLVDRRVVDETVAGGWRPDELIALLLLLGATCPGTPAVPEAPTRTARAAPSTTRRDELVQLGLDLARREPTGNALDHVRAADVAQRMGLTAGAFYHCFDGQDAFRDDLIDLFFAADRYVDPGAVARQLDVVADAPDMADAYRLATTWYWEVAARHPANRVLFGFYAVDDPYVAEHLAAAAADLRRAWHVVVDRLLQRFDRRLRSPLTSDVVVLGMGSIMDGLLIADGLGLDPSQPDDEGWTRWGRACSALIHAASSPPGDGRSLMELGEEALGG